MTGIKTTQNLPLLLENALRKSQIENIGPDLRNIDDASISKEEKIKRIAIQFEEVLINTLLKETLKEEENKEGEEDGLLLHMGTVNDLRHMFLSQYIADNGGLGYREIIEQQIKDHYFSSPTPAGSASTLKALESVPHIPAWDPEKTTSPVPGLVSSQYGWRKDPIDGLTRFHKGIDFDIPLHTPVKSFMEGEVTFSGWENGYGYLVEIKHPNGFISRYGHNAELKVKEGDYVDSGSVIALSGSSGRSTGPHLHFELRKGEFSLNPEVIMGRLNSGLTAKNMV